MIGTESLSLVVVPLSRAVSKKFILDVVSRSKALGEATVISPEQR